MKKLQHYTWRVLHFLWSLVSTQPCPHEWIDWRNEGLAPGDRFHDVFRGKCRFCGRVHTSELGWYRKERP